MNSSQKSCKPAAIVVKIDSVTGLQTARILAKYGIPVIGIADDPGHFCCTTNACEQILTTDTCNEELIDTLKALGKKQSGKSVIFPCSDDSVLILSKHRDKLKEWHELVISDYDIVDLLMDKVKLYQYLEHNGFAIPAAFFASNKSEIREIAGKVSYPCIIKPPRPEKRWFEYFEYKVLRIRGPEELYVISDNCIGAADTFIIQEWIDGTDSDIYQYYYYFDKNYKPIINYTSRKLRQYPIEMGEASLAEYCLSDPVPRELIKFHENLHCRGIISLEIKIDKRSGRYFIIEPDVGRPNTSIGLLEASGVPILYTMYRDALGMPLPEYKVPTHAGIKWISLHRDTAASWLYLKKGKLSLKQWIASVKGVNTFAVLSIRDPLPFLLDSYKLFILALKLMKRNTEKTFKRMIGKTIKTS